MSLHLEDNYITILDTNEIFAVLQNGKIEIWDADGAWHYGNIPSATWMLPFDSASLVRLVMSFYEAGYDAGHNEGYECARQNIRNALGVTK